MSGSGTSLIRETGLRTVIRRLFLFLVLCFCGVDDAVAQTYPASWPADSSWMNYTQLGAVLQDLATAAGDNTDGGTGVNPDSADVYNGTSGTLPSVYFYYDASNQVLFFRMRLRGNPQQGGQLQLQNGTWNAVLDTDGDGFKEFFIELNGNGTDTLNIYYGDTARQDIVSADCSDGEGRVFTLSAVMSTHYRITAATGGGFFLDFQAPLSGFDNCGGAQVITTSTPFSLVFTTSATTQNPTQKDLTGPGDYAMAATSMLPFADSLTLSGGITQNPVLSGMTHACGVGTNFDPITLTATVMDTLLISGSGSSASIVDSISSVTFFYRISGSSTYVQIAQTNAPASGTVNTWQTTWSTASIPSTTYAVRVLIVDEQGNQIADSSYAIDLGTCNKVAAPTSVEILSFAARDDGKGRVSLTWETGNELDNLGFNLYRDEKNRRTLINRDLIAGSAFLTAPGILLSAGMSYRWLDASPGPSKDVEYWLEDIDLNGNSSWHGPFAVQPLDLTEESHSSADAAPLLGSLAGDSLPGHIPPARPIEQMAKAPKTSAKTLALQSAIASQPAIKIAVNRQGLYRISQPQLLAAGLSPAVDPRNLQMMADGRPLPVIVRGQEDGRLDPQDYLEFYGIAPDSPYSADRMYWLFSAPAPGSRIQVTASDDKPATAASFPYTVERRDKTFYFSSLVNGEAENFFGAVVASSPVLQVLKLRNIAASKSPASIEVALQGVTLTSHQVEVSLNGDVIGVARFFDRERGLLKADIPQSLLREGDNIVTLQRQTGNNSVSLVERIRITYQHSYRADDDFLQLEAEGGQQVEVSGFTSASIRILDVTDPDDVKEISCLVSKGDGFAASASVPGQGKRVLIALAGSQSPVAVTPNLPSLWRQTGLGADLVILSRRELFDSLKPLVAHRQSRGLSVATVDLEDIYDEFNFGHKSPQAIKDFLAYTRSWKRSPRFVLLAGDGTYDPKDYAGGGSLDVVPIKLVGAETMETASDDWYADFDLDGVAEIALGRLPVRSPQEVSKIVAKIIAFERGPRFDSAVLISDADRIYDFDAAARNVQSHIPGSVRVDQVSRSQMGDAAARAKILDSISAGAALINYIGHGTLRAWNGGLLTAGDAASLPNADRPALFVLMTCLNGLFQNLDTDSLAESLVKSDAGAAAVWASSGLTKSNEQVLMNKELVRQLFAEDVTTIGEAIKRAKMHVSDPHIRRTWIFFGDPAMRTR